ncbi:MAG: hypothetical protein R3F11_04600 [Verrucomicrobiales bacterium]
MRFDQTKIPSPAASPAGARFAILIADRRRRSAARAEQAVKVKLADGFDFPCGPPDGKGYYKARGFW